MASRREVVSRPSPSSLTMGCSRSQSSRMRCPAPFLLKTYDLLEGEGEEEKESQGYERSAIVSWNGEGTGFVVWSPLEFSQFMLPKYFKHNNFSSFIRQLNTYGFKKSASGRWEFQHEKFKKGERHLLVEITRRKCEPSIFPTFLRASAKKELAVADGENYHLLLEENKKLREENLELQIQIEQFKALEIKLLNCLAQYMGSSHSKARKLC